MFHLSRLWVGTDNMWSRKAVGGEESGSLTQRALQHIGVRSPQREMGGRVPGPLANDKA